MKKRLGLICGMLVLGGCATITNDSHEPITFTEVGCKSFSLQRLAKNKRETYTFSPPAKVLVRRSDDPLEIVCKDRAGKRFKEVVPSRIDAKIMASVFFMDLGITDGITDMHREYPRYVPINCHENRSFTWSHPTFD